MHAGDAGQGGRPRERAAAAAVAPDFATGGGTQPAKLGAALQHAFTCRRTSPATRTEDCRQTCFSDARKIAPRSQELVFLDADDDLGTIRSKLESSSAEEIYLVIPRRSSVLRTPLEFRILARIANEMSSETILVTDDPSRRRLANQEGFRTRRGLRTLKHLMLGPGPASAALRRARLGAAADAHLVLQPRRPADRRRRWPSVGSTRRCTSRSCRRRGRSSRSVDVTVDPDAKAADASTATLPASCMSVPGRRLGQRADPVRPHHRPGQGAWRGDHHQPAPGAVQPAARARPCASTAARSSPPTRI